MTTTNNSAPQEIHSSSLAKYALIGGGIGVTLIAFFVLQVNNPDPSWCKLWMLQPFTITPIAGASAGAFYYYLQHLAYLNGWGKAWVTILSLIACAVILWLGFVLGFSGTLWD